MPGEGWRELEDESLFDVMRGMAEDGDDPVGIAVIAVPSEDKPTIYGAAFSGVPASALAKAATSGIAREQIAILAVCTAQVHGRKVLREARHG